MLGAFISYLAYCKHQARSRRLPSQCPSGFKTKYYRSFLCCQPQKIILAVQVENEAPISVQSPRGMESLGVSRETCDGLKTAFNIVTPTCIQRKVIPALFGGTNVIIGAVTGSGKTLAYLVPIIEKIKLEEQHSEYQRKPKKPRAIILVPTRELGEQVLRVLKALCHHVKFRAISLLGGNLSFSKQKDMLENTVDIAVCSPKRLLKHVIAGNIFVGDIRFIVMDEVDALVVDDFAADLDNLLGKLSHLTMKERPIQFIAVGATHPKKLIPIYEKYFPGAKYIQDKLHTLPKNIKHVFVSIQEGDAIKELLSLLDEEMERGMKRYEPNHIIVFCNTVKSCRFVDHYLSERGYSTVNYHGEIPPKKRQSLFSEFVENKRPILICTDVGSRGLDNIYVKLIINFEWPLSVVDYIHRAGRTGRAGRPGKVVSLVRKEHSNFAKILEQGIAKEKDLLEYCAEHMKKQHKSH